MSPEAALRILRSVNPQAAAVIEATLEKAVTEKDRAVTEKDRAVEKMEQAVEKMEQAITVTLEMARTAAQLLCDRDRYVEALWLVLLAHSRTRRDMPWMLQQAADEFGQHSRAARQLACGELAHAKRPRHSPGRRSQGGLPAVPLRRPPHGTDPRVRPAWTRFLTKFLLTS